MRARNRIARLEQHRHSHPGRQERKYSLILEIIEAGGHAPEQVAALNAELEQECQRHPFPPASPRIQRILEEVVQ